MSKKVLNKEETHDFAMDAIGHGETARLAREKPDHPNFERCYAEGVDAQTSGVDNPYVPGTDEFSFFEAGYEGVEFDEVDHEEA